MRRLAAWLAAAAFPASAQMGATPLAGGGAVFRVWAPNATSVHVRGVFNGWGLGNPLVRDGATGVWSGTVAAARPGDAYKYYVTNTSPSTPGTTAVWRRDPYSLAVDQFAADDANSVVLDAGAYAWTEKPFARAALEELVIYELHVGSFNAPAGTPATFDEAIGRLDHVAALGANAVEIMPVHESPRANGWGYDTTLLHAVEEEFGGPDGLKRFVEACHARGIAVIADVVYNHGYSGQNDMWNFDLWHGADGGGIWFFNNAEDRDTPWGPRYDFTRPEVRELVLSSVRRYLGEFRMDGLRFDATGFMRWGDGGDVPGAAELLRECTEMVRTEFPGTYLIAEDFRDDRLASKPAAAGGLGFDTEWSPFAYDLVGILADDDGDRSMAAAAAMITGEFNGGAFRRIVFSESHDTAANEDPPHTVIPYRGGYLPFRLDQSTAATSTQTCRLAMLGSVLALTAPGVPMLFMGQEAYATQTFTWPTPPRLEWAAMLQQRAGIVELHRDLIALRRNASGATRGLRGGTTTVVHRNEGADVIAFLRRDAGGPGDDTMVAVNLSPTDFTAGYMIGVPAAGAWRVRFHSDLTSYNSAFSTAPASVADVAAEPIARDGQPARLTIPRLPPYSAMILSQDAPGRSGFVVW